MTEFTPARLAELRAVAEKATPGAWEVEDSLDDDGFMDRVSVGAGTWIETGGARYRTTDLILETDTYGWDEEDCDQAEANAEHVATFSPPTALALIAALEAKTAEVERLTPKQPDGWSTQDRQEAKQEAERRWTDDWDGCQSDFDRGGINGFILGAEWQKARETFVSYKTIADRAEAALERVRALHQEVDCEHGCVFGSEPTGWGDEYSHCEVCVTEPWPCPTIQAIEGADDERLAELEARAERAEAALERVRAAATEVADHWGDQIGTHYDGCWRQHAACLAAQTLAETGADDA